VDIEGQKAAARAAAKVVLFTEPLIPTDVEDKKLLFEQYKLYVEMMDKVSERRHTANSFFLTVSTALVAGLAGFLASSTIVSASSKSTLALIAGAAGILFCYVWRRLIYSYDQLNTGKFVIIHMLESRLPAKAYDAEWKALGEGKNEALYTPFTRVERWIPVVFMAFYGAIVAASLFGLL
jgi:hypothetical protein